MCAFQECACLSVCVISPISSESPCLAMCNVTWDLFVECVTIECFSYCSPAYRIHVSRVSDSSPVQKSSELSPPHVACFSPALGSSSCRNLATPSLPLAGLWELDLPLVVVIQLTTLSTPEALWLVIESLCSGLGCSS